MQFYRSFSVGQNLNVRIHCKFSWFQSDVEVIERLAQRTIFEPQAAISADHKDYDRVHQPKFLNFPSNQGFGIAYDESKPLAPDENPSKELIKATQTNLQDPICLKVNL